LYDPLLKINKEKKREQINEEKREKITHTSKHIAFSKQQPLLSNGFIPNKIPNYYPYRQQNNIFSKELYKC
jgi:hypothetical protein